MAAVVFAIVGAVTGTLVGFPCGKLAARFLGAEKEKSGLIIGGLVGGMAPWAAISLR